MIPGDRILLLLLAGSNLTLALAAVLGTVFLARIASAARNRPAQAGAPEAEAFSRALADAGRQEEDGPEDERPAIATDPGPQKIRTGEDRLAQDLARWRTMQTAGGIPDAELLDEILAVLDRRPGEPMGHRQVHQLLVESGLQVSRHQVLKVMRENDREILQIRPSSPETGCSRPAPREV